MKKKERETSSLKMMSIWIMNIKINAYTHIIIIKMMLIASL